jgi:multicomponent K+:H+ antiporter subunit E
MKRLLPSPLLSLGLFILWILLMQSVSLGTLLLGLVVAVFWPAVTARLRPGRVRARRPLIMMRLFGRVVIDMLRSNAAVARAILTRAQRDIPSGFVDIPLDLEDATALAVLAMIVTFTPGTAWVQLSADRRSLLLHVLAMGSEAEIVEHIKRRYEGPLMEIFS